MKALIALIALTLPVAIHQAQQAKPEQPKLPFTAEQAQEFLLPWRVATYTQTMWTGPDPTKKKETVAITYRDVTDDGVTIEFSNAGARGQKPKTVSWKEFMEGNESNIKDTTVRQEKLTVLGAEVDAHAYTVKLDHEEGRTSVRTMWYAASYPGVIIKSHEVHHEAEGRAVPGGGPLLDVTVELTALKIVPASLPWDAKQVQDYYAKAPQFTWETIDPDGEKTKTVQGISEANDDGFTSLVGIVKGEVPIAGKPHKVTWERLLEGLTLPLKDTKATEETIETPAGKFTCILLTNERGRMGGVQTTKVWLSKDHPGLMVKWEQDVPSKGESRVTTKVLTELKVE